MRGQQEVEALTVLQSRRANSHLCTQPRRPLERADTSWAPPRCRPPQSFLCKTGVTPSPPSQDAGEICQAWAGVLGTDPHGSASRDQQAGLPGEGTPSSRVLCGAALGSRSHARTSSPARKKTKQFHKWPGNLQPQATGPESGTEQPSLPAGLRPQRGQGSAALPPCTGSHPQEAGCCGPRGPCTPRVRPGLTCRSPPSPPRARPAGWLAPHSPAPCRRHPAQAPGTSWCCRRG